MDCYLFATLLAVIVCELSVHHCWGKPLEGGLSPTTGPAVGGGVPQGVSGCVRHLHHRIERCLTRYEQLLVTYRSDATDQEQRDRLRASFCHQYQVTLQCLHEVLVDCPAQPEHLNLIEVRLGYLRTYMHLTCNTPQPNNTPRPTTRAPPPPTEETTPTPTTQPTTTNPTTTRVRTPRVTPTTTRKPKVKSTTGKIPQPSTEKTPSSSTDSVPGEPNWRDLENNSVKGYTINHRGPSSVPPPGAKPTSYQKTKLQLLFARHEGGDVRGKTGLSGDSSQAKDKKEPKHIVPVMIITEDGTNNAIVQAHMSKQVDCTVDDRGKIDVRCVFSGAEGLTWSISSTILTFTFALVQLLR